MTPHRIGWRASMPVIAIALTAGCQPGSDASAPWRLRNRPAPPRPTQVTPAPPTNPPVAERPYRVMMAAPTQRGARAPLLIGLHGYTGETFQTDAVVFHIAAAATARGMIFAGPQGTRDRRGRPFWNATQACCNFYGSTVDDVAYLSAVIDDVSAHYAVDPDRVFVIGHSNGGFMANRLACDRSDRIAAVVNLGGSGWVDQTRCQPTHPVAVLTIRSDADRAISYFGGTAFPVVVRDPIVPPDRYPSALETAAFWGVANHCDPAPIGPGAPFDVDANVAGAETRALEWTHCEGGAVSLWTIHGGAHDTPVSPAGAARILDFLLAHPREPAGGAAPSAR